MKKREQPGVRRGNQGSATVAQPRSFEQALARLEQIVERLESGEESLENSLTLYEEAMSLSRFCEERLHAAEERIAKLADETNQPASAEERTTKTRRPEDGI